MSLIKNMCYKNVNVKEDLKNMLASIKVEVNKLEGLANKNGSSKDLNRIVHKLNEMRTLAENCQEKATKYQYAELQEMSKKTIKRIRKVEKTLFSSLKNGNYYQFK